MKIAIHTVFILKENILFIEEWIYYHILLGFNKFYLYDNSKMNKVTGFDNKPNHKIIGNKVNKYGILEPAIKTRSLDPNVVLVPLLAFDKNNYRLGYGKGYYDKFLNKYIRMNKNILTIGVTFSFQKYNKLPISKFDVKLNYVLTEKGIVK